MNKQNGVLTSDTGHNSYGNQNTSSTYYSDNTLEPEPEYSDTIPTTTDKNHGYEYYECYRSKAEDYQQEIDVQSSVDNWFQSKTSNEYGYGGGFEYATVPKNKGTSTKLLPMLPVNENSNGTGSDINSVELNMQGMCVEMRQKQTDGSCHVLPQSGVVNELQNIYTNNINGYYANYSLSSNQHLIGFNAEDLSECNPGQGTGTVTPYGVPRPYTSMLPLDYSAYQECNYSADNLSTYSDTPPISNAQLKLQNQRKISLMMAMTTASVIASGETRVPVHSMHSKKLMPTDYDNVATIDTFLEKECSDTGTLAALSAMTTTTTIPPKTRKLPKLLPTTPHNKSSFHSSNITTATDATQPSSPLLYCTGSITAEKTHRPKQLPKLPTTFLAQTKNSIYPTSSPSAALSLNPLAENTTSPLLSPTASDSKTLPTKAVNEDNREFESAIKHSSPNRCSPEKLPLNVISQDFATDENKKPHLSDLDIDTNVYLEIKKASQSPDQSSFIKPDADALLNISDYLKPYTFFDTNTFSGGKEQPNPIITNTTASTSSIKETCSDNEELISNVGDTTQLPNFSTWNYDGSEFKPTTTIEAESIMLSFSSSLIKTDLEYSSITGTPQDIDTTDCNRSYNTFTPTVSSINNSTVLPTKNNGTVLPSINNQTDIVLSSINNQPITVLPLTITPSREASPSPSTLTLTSPLSSIIGPPIISYNDYMKQFDLPDLPQPIVQLDTSENNITDSFAINTDTSNITSNACNKELDNVTSEPIDTVPVPSYLSEIGAYKFPSFLTTINDIVPIDTIVCSVDSPTKLTNYDSTTEATVNNSSAFDDTFYDSFNVDIKELTASVATIKTETDIITANVDNNSISSIDHKTPFEFTNEKTNIDMNQNLKSSGLGAYYKPSQTQQTAKVMASAATSVLGGFSKGLKGGLDGVFSGVSGGISASTTVDLNNTQQPNPNNTKKGFSFNLASKLVPSVGGLLSSSGSKVATKTEAETTFLAENDSHSAYLDTSSPPSNLYENKEQGFLHGTTAQESSFYDSSSIVPINLPICDNYNETYDDDINLNDEMMLNVGMYDHENEYGLREEQHPYSLEVLNRDNGYIAQKDITNETVIEQAILPESTTKKGGIKSGGMFGSILTKAAAAVQSATQAVNQGASSVASVVAQKPSTTTLSIPIHNTTCPDISTSSNPEAKIENFDYNYQQNNQDTTQSIPHYLTTGDDYENSNVKMNEYTNNITYSTEISKPVSMSYHSNGNQSTKILPTVPLAGTTGKKLPTINGKSGLMLIKQMPTEIYDDDSEVDDELLDQVGQIAVRSSEPNYHIDSVQNDYYMDLQQTTPSTNQSQRTNGYYEHVNNGYDYREDYFNEEDEYKYLEQEEQQQNQPKNKNNLAQKQQSSLDFIDEEQQRDNDDDDFIYDNDNYHSEEDSGNYLDESSSGSVGPIQNRQLLKMEVHQDSNGDAPMSDSGIPAATIVSLHKQDSIIIDQDLVEQATTLNLASFMNDPDLIDREEELNDQLTDLNDLSKIISQKKKPLLLRGETEEVVSGHMQMIRQPEITAKQRWHWAYNKIIIQLNVSTTSFLLSS